MALVLARTDLRIHQKGPKSSGSPFPLQLFWLRRETLKCGCQPVSADDSLQQSQPGSLGIPVGPTIISSFLPCLSSFPFPLPPSPPSLLLLLLDTGSHSVVQADPKTPFPSFILNLTYKEYVSFGRSEQHPKGVVVVVRAVAFSVIKIP